MDSVTKASLSYRFDGVLVDANRRRIEVNGQPRKITPRAFDVLVYLVEHRDRTVEKQELFDEVWREKFVTDNALTRVIKEIRQVIGDDADAPRYIETLQKHGYRFIAEIREAEAARPVAQKARRHISKASSFVRLSLDPTLWQKRWVSPQQSAVSDSAARHCS